MGSRRVYIIIRNDDPGALSPLEHERRVFSLFERHGVPQVAAVVPRVVGDPHDEGPQDVFPLHENRPMVELLKDYHSRGLLEIAQHGFTHQTNRTRPSAAEARDSAAEPFPGIAGPWLPFRPQHPDGYSEFAGLAFAEQRDKVVKGKAYLEELFGTRLSTFVFPWNTFDRESLRSLKEAGFRCVLIGEEPVRFRGLLVLDACLWWDSDEDLFTLAVEEALSRRQSSLLHLSLHSWMLTDKDLASLDRFLAKFAEREDVVFITPSQIPSLPYAVGRDVQLRTWVRRAGHRVLRHVRVNDVEYCDFPLGTTHLLGRLHRHGVDALIFMTLGISGWLVASTGLAALCLIAMSRPGLATGPWLALWTLLLAFAVYMLVRSNLLLRRRTRQHRLEGGR